MQLKFPALYRLEMAPLERASIASSPPTRAEARQSQRQLLPPRYVSQVDGVPISEFALSLRYRLNPTLFVRFLRISEAGSASMLTRRKHTHQIQLRMREAGGWRIAPDGEPQ